MDLGAVSRQVRLLESAGAVRRSRDPDDGRVALLELTAKGQRMAEGIRAAGVRHLEAALQGWSDADRHALARQLGRLVDDLVATPVPARRANGARRQA
jgi:DNA-binding MarR family transcriptional regulator